MKEVEIKKCKAVIYCRVSTEDQAKDGFSLKAQKERLKSYCIAKEWDLRGEYIDDGYSGRSTNRPAYRRMMDERDKWDIMVVLKMDRVHRNSKNFTIMMEELNEWGKEFTSMQESFDTTTAMGRFVMDIIQRIAQLESEQIGERVYIGMMQKAKEGKGILGFNIPYGYDIHDSELIINEDEADEVQKMYQKYLTGDSLRKISKDLFERGVLTKKGLRKWEPKTIQRILSNPIYIGIHKWEDILYKGNFEGLVDIPTFIQVQERLHRKSNDMINKLVEGGFVSIDYIGKDCFSENV